MAKRKGGVPKRNDRPVAAGRSSTSKPGSDDNVQFNNDTSNRQPKLCCANCKFGRFRPGKRKGYCRTRPTIPCLAGGVVLSDAVTGMQGGHKWSAVMVNELCAQFQRRGGIL